MKRENLVEQHKFLVTNPFIDHKNISFDNFIIEATSDNDKWIEETTTKIGDWRGIFRSAYIKWAISINGLYLAKEKYEKLKADDLFVFNIHSLRPTTTGTSEQVVIAEWDADLTSKAHFDTIPMMCTYGFTDLYNCLEEFVFDFYRIYWKHNPDNLIKGPDNKYLRKLRANATFSVEENIKWETAFNERLDKWQRNKLFDNIGKVFLSYCNEAGLKKPKSYRTTPEN